MEGLQRSTVSFRRSGSSGLVWDDKLLNQLQNQVEKEQQQQQQTSSNQQQETTRPASLKIDRSRSNGGGRGFRTGNVPPSIEPPSPKLSTCACCNNPFAKTNKTRRRPPKSAKRVM